jgi:TPR repeat protein
MSRKCPHCGQFRTRRSTIRADELTLSHVLLSPYRCRDCQHRFWVVSRNAYYFAAALVSVAVVTAAAIWTVQRPLESPAPVSSVQAGKTFADTLRRAQANEREAQHEVAMMYSSGEGIAKSETEAKKWLERAAAQGHVAAEYDLGIALRDGRGVVQDYERAAVWMRRAAEHGHAHAQLALGMMYRLGNGVPANNVEAYTWLNIAAARGVPEAVVVRDSVLSRLSPQEVADAQAEARRLSEALPVAPAPDPR